MQDIPDLSKTVAELNKLKDNKDYANSLRIIDSICKSIKIQQQIHKFHHNRYILIMKKNYDKHRLADKFDVGDYVAYFVGDRSSRSRKLKARYSGPFKLIARVIDNTVRIANEDNGETLDCHVTMLKRYFKEFFTPEMVFNRTQRVKQVLNQHQRKNHRHR